MLAAPRDQFPATVQIPSALLFLGEIGYREIVVHISDNDLERYALGSLPEAELAPLEEHLLICSECRDRLEATEQYVMAMLAAAAHIRNIGTGK